jgi:hypothetical protein
MQKKPVSPAKLSAVAAAVSLGFVGISFVLLAVLGFLFGMISVRNSIDAFQMRTILRFSGLAILGVLSLSALTISVWTYQIARAAKKTAPTFNHIKPHLSAFSWFIPVVNFFAPFNEIRRCRNVLLPHLPVSGLTTGKAYTITLWQLGFILCLLSQSMAMVLLKIKLKPDVNLNAILGLFSLATGILGCAAGIITLFQYFRLEKLVYPHLTSAPQTEQHA